jgi:hypothetical protein
MARGDFLDSWFRGWFGFARVVTTIMVFVGMVGALGASLDATIGGGFYDFRDAFACLAIAAFGLVFRLIALPMLRSILGVSK